MSLRRFWSSPKLRARTTWQNQEGALHRGSACKSCDACLACSRLVKYGYIVPGRPGFHVSIPCLHSKGAYHEKMTRHKCRFQGKRESLVGVHGRHRTCGPHLWIRKSQAPIVLPKQEADGPLNSRSSGNVHHQLQQEPSLDDFDQWPLFLFCGQSVSCFIDHDENRHFLLFQ
jgi:hypothetical protein